MEKFPSDKRESGISRVVGVEESTEQEILEYFKGKFIDERGRHPAEQEHSPELKKLIDTVNEKMEEFMAGYGVESLNIPGRNIHIMDLSKLDEHMLKLFKERYEKVRGMYVPENQQIVIWEKFGDDNKILFLQTLVHEMIHMNAFNSEQKIESGGREIYKGDQKISVTSRRIGFEIYSDKTHKNYFHDINEAITSELTKRFDQSYFSEIEELRTEFDDRNNFMQELIKIKGQEADPIAFIERKQSENGYETVLHSHAYTNQRKELIKLIKDLYEKNKDEFKSAEEVFSIFAKAALNGRLLPVARLIEKTYGEGSFREIGEKTSKSDE